MAPITKDMNFLERTVNFVSYFVEYFVFKYIFYLQEQNYIKYFPSDKYPSFEETYTNVSLILASQHFSQNKVKPLLPTIIEIGGIQVKKEVTPLPDVRKYSRILNQDTLFSLLHRFYKFLEPSKMDGKCIGGSNFFQLGK